MRSPRVVVIAVILVAILIVGAVAWLAVTVVDNRSEYTKHSPISIVGNGGFTHANGVVSGSGNASDPYIIANWDINESNSVGIYIENTDARFIIRNCQIIGSLYGISGILLVNCINGILENNTLLHGAQGISLVRSNNNTLSNNSCSSCGVGIYLDQSCNNTLTNNNCSSNHYDGIGLTQWCDNNMLTNNTCTLNGADGVSLFSSSSNTLANNNCSSNGNYGIELNSTSNDSNDNEISWNQISNNGGCGVDISSSSGSNNRIFDNAFIGNNGATGTYTASHAQARDDGTHNLWNYTYVYSWDEPGNYWSDWTKPDAVPPQHIVDLPYIIAGSAGAKDYNPLTFNPLYIGIAFVP